jgi:hypothetical protein
MLHTMLDNSRLDGEYFWDGNETLVDAVSDFMAVYHPNAQHVGVSDDADVEAAAEGMKRKNSERLYTDVIPRLDKIKIKHSLSKSGRSLRFVLNDYTLDLGGRSGNKYTLTIWSKTKTTEEALNDFDFSQELAAHGSEDSNRRARISMSSLDSIFESLSKFIEKSGLKLETN